MSLGSENEVVVGEKATISIGGSVFNLKEIFDLTRDRPVVSDGSSSGTNHTFGSGRHRIDILIEATTPDLATIDAYNERNAAGDLPSQTIVITYPPISLGAAVTETFNAKFHTITRNHTTSNEKVKVRLTGVITSEDQTWA